MLIWLIISPGATPLNSTGMARPFNPTTGRKKVLAGGTGPT